MSFKKTGFEDSLQRHVVSTGKCLGCGACIVVCPHGCLEYLEEEPRVVKDCRVCGLCSQACPQCELSLPEVENFVFGRERRDEEEFGVYRRIVLAKSENDELLKVCQDGGVVTALLQHALDSGFVDCAVVSGISQIKPFYPTVKVATSPQEVLDCAGTRYFYSPNLLGLREAVKLKRTGIAFVGTPCQVNAIRKMEMGGLEKYTSPVKILIGLMCFECFSYEGLMKKHLHGNLGINLNDIKKVNIKGKMIVTTKSGLVKAIPLAEIKQYSRKSCEFCRDFSSEIADISAGGLGLEGWTFTIARTEKGEDLLSMAERAGIIKTRNADEEAGALSLLRRLSRKKRSRSFTS